MFRFMAYHLTKQLRYPPFIHLAGQCLGDMRDFMTFFADNVNQDQTVQNFTEALSYARFYFLLARITQAVNLSAYSENSISLHLY